MQASFNYFMCPIFLYIGRDRSKYLLIKTAKIIAMTCTHAALRRRDLVELNFKVQLNFDT